jgi:hypothetical protein
MVAFGALNERTLKWRHTARCVFVSDAPPMPNIERHGGNIHRNGDHFPSQGASTSRPRNRRSGSCRSLPRRARLPPRDAVLDCLDDWLRLEEIVCFGDLHRVSAHERRGDMVRLDGWLAERHEHEARCSYGVKVLDGYDVYRSVFVIDEESSLHPVTQ